MAVGITRQSYVRWENPIEIVASTFEGPQGTQIRGFQVADWKARRRDGPHAAPARYGSMEISGDAVELYFTLGTDRALYHTRDGAEPLQLAAATTGAGGTPDSPHGSVVLPTRDSRAAAFVGRGDSLWLFDAVARTSRPLTGGCSGLLDFSRDGTELLCRYRDALYVVRMDDGAVRPFLLPAGRNIHALVSARWTRDGVRLLFRTGGGGLELVDAATGAATLLMDDLELDTHEMADLGTVAWAPDARAIAFAISRCRSLVDCGNVAQHAVYLLPVDGSAGRRVWQVHFADTADDPGIGELIFSPDGRHLAIVAGTDLRAALRVASIP